MNNDKTLRFIKAITKIDDFLTYEYKDENMKAKIHKIIKTYNHVCVDEEVTNKLIDASKEAIDLMLLLIDTKNTLTLVEYQEKAEIIEDNIKDLLNDEYNEDYISNFNHNNYNFIMKELKDEDFTNEQYTAIFDLINFIETYSIKQ